MFPDELQDPPELRPKKRRAGFPVDPYRVLAIVRRGRWWVASAALLGVVVALLAAATIFAPRYEAQASLRYEGFQLPGDEGPLDSRRELPSKLPVLHSDQTLMEVRERFGLSEPLEAVRRRFEILSDAETGLVTIKATGESAVRAEQLANTLGELFEAHHVERNTQRIDEQLEILDDRLTTVRASVDEARENYDAFREDHGIADLDAEQEQAIAGAARLRSNADLAEAEVHALEARVEQLRSHARSLPRVSRTQRATSSQQAQRLAETRVRLAEARSRYADNHPMVQALERQAQSLARSVRGSRGSRSSSGAGGRSARSDLAEAQADLSAARQRYQNLRRLANESHERTNQLTTIEGQASGLLAEVQVAEALLRDLREQRARLVDARRHVTSGFVWVAPAEPPENALPSKRRYAAFVGAPLLLAFLMVAFLVGRELRGLRAVTPAEVAYWGDGPVIGSTSWPSDQYAVASLVADLDDWAPEATGTVLVVGASTDQRDLAAELAGELNYDWVPKTVVTPPPDDDEEPAVEEDAIEGDIVDAEPHDSHAIVRARTSALALAPVPDYGARLIAHAWQGESRGQELRRAARLVDRVLVVVRSNEATVAELAALKRRLGREHGVGFVVVDIGSDLASDVYDRVGDLESFWSPQPHAA